MPSLDKKIFGSFREDLAIGWNVSVVKAKAKDEEIRSLAQYGGVVSALLVFALKRGEIELKIFIERFKSKNSS